MDSNKVIIRYFDSSLKLVSKGWPIKNLRYVEDLIFDVLSSLCVSPVYQYLFGIRLLNRKEIWLAPNITIQELLDRWEDLAEDPTCELRMRYRPSSFTRMTMNDKTAFEMVFAQARYDFLNTKFTNEKRDFILLNETVINMIACDLLRHAIEMNIQTNEIFKRSNIRDFIPRRAAKWQKSLLFHLETLPSSIQTTMNLVASSCDKDITRIKRGYIELFFGELCKEYGAETYKILLTDKSDNTRPVVLRLRYEQTTENSMCILECQSDPCGSTSKPTNNWTILCEIESISLGTLRERNVVISRSDGPPLKMTFDSKWHAKSFLSLLDGYYRLMRKWHFNLCCSISSPELEKLKKSWIHGPIGYATMLMKLPPNKKPGTFLIRKCMEKYNRYLIDVITSNEELICLDVDYDCEKKLYICSSIDQTNMTIFSDEKGYSSLKDLVYDLQIKCSGKSPNHAPLQLRYWIKPTPYDDCPALLLSISKAKLKEFDVKLDKFDKPLSDLPCLVPRDMINYKKKLTRRALNRMFVSLGKLTGGEEIVIKDCIDNGSYDKSKIENTCYSDLILDARIKEPKNRLLERLKPAQVRLIDWIFIKQHLFAETIGFDILNNALIQEYFPLGPLDVLLSKNKGIAEISRRSICCQMADALIFLQEKRVVHGKIRCHNVFVKSFSEAFGVQIKFADPLGTFDAEKDRAFLAPEYLGLDGNLHITEYDSAIDVWALGTTFWQIYSHGVKPPAGRYPNSFRKPDCCPDSVWSIIESCWVLNAGCRASPQDIHRDMYDSYTWDKTTNDHDYAHLFTEGSDCTSQQSVSLITSDDGTQSRQSNANFSTAGSLTSRESGSQKPLLPPRRQVLNDRTLQANGISRTRERFWINFFSRNRSNRTPKRKHENYSSTLQVSAEPSSSTSACFESNSTISDATTVSAGERRIQETNGETQKSWSIDLNNLRMGPEIGRGSSGVVIKGDLLEWAGFSEQVVAIKCVNDPNSCEQIEDLKREFELLKSLDHKNIIRTLGLVQEESTMLVVEYMPLGSLLSFIKNTRHDLKRLPLIKYATDIALGMQYLETQKIVHRDLALRNILCKNQFEVKIGDFGLAQSLGIDDHYKLKTDRALPLRWYAPEVLNYWTFTHKTDVWSYGVVLWEIYSGGCSPHYSGTHENLAEILKHERLQRPVDCPDMIYNLMLSCWTYEPNDRHSFNQVVENLATLQSPISPADTAITYLDGSL